MFKNLLLESHRKTAMFAVFGGVPSPAGLPGGMLWVLESEPVLLFCRVCVVPSGVLLSSRLVGRHDGGHTCRLEVRLNRSN